MRHLGRDVWFNLDTANVSVAAVNARDIYLSLVSAGWTPTLDKFKPKPEAAAEVCTVGEFLTDVGQRSHLKPRTLRRYAVKLHKMIADLAGLEGGPQKEGPSGEIRLRQRRPQSVAGESGRAAVVDSDGGVGEVVA